MIEELETYPNLIDHLIQSEIPEKLVLDGKVITCDKYDSKYDKNVENRLEEEFPEHIIGCKALEKEKKVISVTSRNTLTVRSSSTLKIESKVQCDYFATSICALITGGSLESCHVYFGSVIGDLIDWIPYQEEKPVMRKGHKGMIFSIVTDSTRIFTISDDRTVRMWKIKERNSGPICTVFGHTARPFSICVDPIQRLIYTGGIEQTLFCWKYDDESITLTQKTNLSIGVIRKISQLDESTLAITSQNGDLLKMNLKGGGHVETEVLRDEVINFCVLKEKLVVLTNQSELLIFSSDSMTQLLGRFSEIKHMSSSDGSCIAWQHNIFVFITEKHVYRFKINVNIISAICWNEYFIIKTVDGYIQIFSTYKPDHMEQMSRFRMENMSTIPATLAVLSNDVMIFGTTHGELYYVEVMKDRNTPEACLDRHDFYELFGGKEVTALRPIGKETIFMALGKTGIWSMIRMKDRQMELMNSRSFAASSRIAWPSKFIEWNNELLIVGFYGTSLIIWSSSTGLPIFETYCGGGHRIWQLTPGNSESEPDSIFNFTYIQGSELSRQSLDFSSKQLLASSAHSSPIVAAAGSLSYLITVSLDGHLSIGDHKGKPIITMFIGENLLCCDVMEEDDVVHVLAGGGKSKFWAIKFKKSEISDGIYMIRPVTRPDEGRIVAVKICHVTSPDTVLYAVSYSSGVIEIFRMIHRSGIWIKTNIESMRIQEIEDSMGIVQRMDWFEGKLICGTSGSFILSFGLEHDGKLEELMRQKLADRSGVTSLTVSQEGSIYFGCDSGHVYIMNKSITKIHSHLSTVVGIVAPGGKVHSVSLDCSILTSSYFGSSTVTRKSTVIDMPNGMIKLGKNGMVVVGDGIQLFDCNDFE